MKHDAATRLLEQQLISNYAGPLVVFMYNAPSRQIMPERFMEFSLDPISSDNLFLGADRSRTVALIVMEMYTPMGQGTRRALREAEELGDVFRNQDFSGVMCYERNIRHVGPVTRESEDIRRFKINVTIPCYFDRKD